MRIYSNMSGTVRVRPAQERDFPALAAMDLAYDASRMLAIDRGGTAGEPAFAFAWRDGAPREAIYNEYGEERLRSAQSRVDLSCVAEVDGVACGLLMIIVPAWTDAAEITDLAVDRAQRRSGAGRLLVGAAVEFARDRGLRALWVEPRTDNAAAIEFYLSLGFRISGFNDRMYSNHDDEAGRTTLFMHLELPASD